LRTWVGLAHGASIGGAMMGIFGVLFEIVNFSVLGGFLASEVIINVSRRGGRGNSDQRSGRITNSRIMAVGGGSIVLGIIIGFMAKFMDIRWLFRPDYFISSLGLLLIVIGVVIRWSAVRTLDRYFTVDVTILGDHKLIRTGLFKYVRHPSYLGLLIAVLGLGITMVNWPSTLVILVPHVVVILMRIEGEEKALEQRFGSDYQDYRAHTGRLIPAIY
jgi:protein-S-isoprenylcysteine O-methyltransferase Ste14